MRNTITALLFISLISTACDRISMEGSPEALVSYGVPSQHSNSETSTTQSNEKEESKSWLSSSAINPKPRPH